MGLIVDWGIFIDGGDGVLVYFECATGSGIGDETVGMDFGYEKGEC